MSIPDKSHHGNNVNKTFSTARVSFLSAFTKLRKVLISFDTSVCPSVLPHGTPRLPLDRFS